MHPRRIIASRGMTFLNEADVTGEGVQNLPTDPVQNGESSFDTAAADLQGLDLRIGSVCEPAYF
jgi:hypothetical protein